MHTKFLGVAALLYVVFPGTVFSQSLSGSMIGNTCAGCHGTLGSAENAIIPPLAGLDEAQLVATMLAYRDGSLRGTIMNRVARAYTDEEIAAMAAYFAALPRTSNE